MPVMIAEREGEGVREQADGTESEKGRARVEARPSAQARAGGMDGGLDDGDPSQRCDVM
jgi:hypothetical protein